MDDQLIITVAEGVQTIRFNRPEKKNAISLEIYKGVTDSLNAAASDNNIKMTVLTGTGDYYSSGNDLSHVSLNETMEMDTFIDDAGDVLGKFVCAFIDYPKLLVAVVNGPAIGVAVTTLALCDLVIASDKATFCTPFSKLGLSVEGCSSYTFPRIMGPIRSMMYSKKLLRGWDREMLHKVNRAEGKQLKERWTSEDFINAFLQFMNKRSKL